MTASAAAQATGLPPKVEPWSPADERGAALAEADARADRQPAAEALGERHHVGGDALGLVGEPRARPADAGLDLVEHQQRAGVVAGLRGRRRGSRPGRGSRRPRPGSARGRPRRPGRRRRCASAAASPYSTQRTSKPNGANGARIDSLPVIASAPMVRPWKLWSAATMTGRSCALLAADHLERRLVGLGARVAEEDAGVGVQQAAQLLGEQHAGLVQEQVAGVRDLADLVGHRVDDRGVRVAERGHGDAGDQVEVAVAVERPRPGCPRRGRAPAAACRSCAIIAASNRCLQGLALVLTGVSRSVSFMGCLL